MASFAERIGKRSVRSLTQHDSLDADTRTELWNVLVAVQNVLQEVGRESYWTDSTEAGVVTAIWTWECKKPRDEMPRSEQVWLQVKSSILNAEWYDVLDLLEAIVKYLDRYRTYATEDAPSAFTAAFNSVFERYLVGQRFVGTEITPVDSTAEAEAVENALEEAGGLAGARHALNRAVELLADRQTPDYPNSIKESISAVETVVRKVTGKGTLGAGLTKLDAAGTPIHPALRGSWSKMYGWASDADGIRHAGINAAEADQALAKYMLVVCSAFVSYLIEEGQKKGLLE